MIGREEVHSDFVRDAEAKGAMYEPDGMGIHAAKLAFGYLRLARKLGARVHTSSPVLGSELKGGVHHLRTLAERSAPAPFASPRLATPRPACTT